MHEPDTAGDPRVDATRWSGEGELTGHLLEQLRREPRIVHIRVEDAPASRSGADYALISNELYVDVAGERRREARRLWRILPVARHVVVPSLTIQGLEAILAADEAVGAPDYSDEGMLQYLRTTRIVQAYQTRGYKLVELVRVYVAGPREAT